MRSKHRGVALIMVLLAMTLVVMLASGMLRQQNLRVFKAGHYLAQQQGYSIALGAEEFAHRILIQDFENDEEQGIMIDSLGEDWAEGAAILPMDDNGVVEVQIDDLGGRLNLNDLVNTAGEVNSLVQARFERLLTILEVEGVNTEALIDWIDADEQPSGVVGAEDGSYLMAEPPYRSANQPFVSVSELRLIEGMTEEAYELLRPHVTALPVTGVGVNINTATLPVLMSLHGEMTEAIGEAIMAEREEEPFDDVDNFLALPELSGMELDAGDLVLQTRFFDVVSRVTYDNREVNMVSRVFRNAEGGVRTVHRNTGQANRITKESYTFPEG